MVKKETPQQKETDTKIKTGNMTAGDSSDKKDIEKEKGDKNTEDTKIILNGQKVEKIDQPSSQQTQAPAAPSVPSALGLLGNYSDSESSD